MYKLSFTGKRFKVNNEKDTVCFLECSLNVPNIYRRGRNIYSKEMSILNSDPYYIKGSEHMLDEEIGFTVRGCSVLSGKDDFDERLGQRISEGRAKKNAYRIAFKLCRMIAEMYYNDYMELEHLKADFETYQRQEDRHLEYVLEKFFDSNED